MKRDVVSTFKCAKPHEAWLSVFLESFPVRERTLGDVKFFGRG